MTTSYTKRTTLRQRSVSAARRLLDKAGICRPPVDLSRLARLQGVSDIRAEPLGAIDAELVPVDSGYIIRVNAEKPEPRRRFSIAHEIAHTFFMPRATSYRNGATVSYKLRGLSHETEERLCDEAAAEMLMPEGMFREKACADRPSIALLKELAKTFAVSLEATALRYANIVPEAPQVTYWFKQGDELQFKWDRGTCIVPATSFAPARRGRSSIIQEALTRAYYGDGPTKAQGVERAVYPPRTVLIQAQGFRQGKERYVLSLMQSTYSKEGES